MPGTAPQGWQNPKTSYSAEDVTSPEQFERIEGNIHAIEQGSRTIDPSQAPTGNVGTLRQFLDWFANRIKAILGTDNWYDAPDTTLAAAASHISATNAHGATSAATASRIVMRDASGRAQVAEPSTVADIATKGYVDAHDATMCAVDTVVLASELTEVQLRPYPEVRRQFRVWCPGAYQITFSFRSASASTATTVYLYRIRGGQATQIGSWTYDGPDWWPNYKSMTTTVSNCQSGDYISFYTCTWEDSQTYASLRDVSVRGSFVQKTV